MSWLFFHFILLFPTLFFVLTAIGLRTNTQEDISDDDSMFNKRHKKSEIITFLDYDKSNHFFE